MHPPIDSRGKSPLSPDGNILAAGASGKSRFGTSKTGKEIQQFDGHRAEVTAAGVQRVTDKRLVSASKDSTALVWDLSK